MIRPATHAGTWYTGNSTELNNEIKTWLAKTTTQKSRFAIGPHAGLRFCGEVLAHTYGALRGQPINRVVVMGPTHFKYFKGIKTTQFTQLDTPFGAVKVDTDVTSRLLNAKAVTTLDEQSDLKEHSWEMHLPFLKSVAQNAKIVPLLFGAVDAVGAYHRFGPDAQAVFQELFNDPQTAFVVSSDFCHWGASFDYTPFADQGPLIYKQIENLDREALDVLTNGSSAKWQQYIAKTGNTICGEKPIGFLLSLGEAMDSPLKFDTLRYTQSNKVKQSRDMSVSYASAIA